MSHRDDRQVRTPSAGYPPRSETSMVSATHPLRPTPESVLSLKRLTVFLLRDVSTAEDALRADRTPTPVELDPASGLTGRFFYETSNTRTPSWVAAVNPALTTNLQSVFSASASGLLVLEQSKRFFAFTFGYGKGFLNPAKIQRQFGLRVALNRVDPAQMRSMDTKTFEDMVVTKNTQTSRSSDIPTFGVDVSRDILRAVAGEPRDKTFAKRLAGSDALVLSLDTEIGSLAKKCDDLLAAYVDTAYQADFEWIDHLAVVEEPERIEALDSLLESQLRVGDVSFTHMATPEPVAWEDIDVFRIGGTRSKTYDDLDLPQYIKALGPKTTEITIQKLKQRDVAVRYTRSGDFDGLWSVYQCLVSEQRLNGDLHVLIEGRWFAVSGTLVGQVDTFLGSLPVHPPAIEDAFSGELEPAYNARMANAHPADLLLLDAKIKRPGGASTGIEFCDLLSSRGELIHIKRKSRSSTLSHLFAQGSVSATTFLADGDYRDELRKAVKKAAPRGSKAKWLDLVPGSSSKVDKSKYTISYVVLTSGSRSGTDWLPFFSKLNLMQHGRQLQNIGFQVTLTGLSN